MGAATITAICTGVPAVIGAVTALIIALKSHGTATAASQAVTDHIASTDKQN
jgi:hypothetical protein